jgi:hypothetical protein
MRLAIFFQRIAQLREAGPPVERARGWPSRPPDGAARRVATTGSGAAPMTRLIRARPSRPALRWFRDRAALSRSCRCWQEPAATRPQETVVLLCISEALSQLA